MITKTLDFPFQPVTGGYSKEKGDTPVDGRQGKSTMNVLQHKQHFNSPVSKEMIVTPKWALKWLKECQFERQRAIDPQNVSRLAYEMSNGRFIQGTQIYFCILPDGSEALVNGNHTLNAVVKSGTSQWLTITHRPVKDLEEAGRIYAVFDTQKNRSLTAGLKAIGKANDIPYSARVLGAIGIIQAGFSAGTTNSVARLDRLDGLEEYREQAVLFSQLLHKAPKNSSAILMRASILSVILETLKHQPSLAYEFWGRVASDNGLTEGMPERAILNWARNSVATGEVARGEHIKAAALAWNASFRGEQISRVQPRRMGSFFILGTPYASGIQAGI